MERKDHRHFHFFEANKGAGGELVIDIVQMRHLRLGSQDESFELTLNL